MDIDKMLYINDLQFYHVSDFLTKYIVEKYFFCSSGDNLAELILGLIYLMRA